MNHKKTISLKKAAGHSEAAPPAKAEGKYMFLFFAMHSLLFFLSQFFYHSLDFTRRVDILLSLCFLFYNS